MSKSATWTGAYTYTRVTYDCVGDKDTNAVDLWFVTCMTYVTRPLPPANERLQELECVY